MIRGLITALLAHRMAGATQIDTDSSHQEEQTPGPFFDDSSNQIMNTSQPMKPQADLRQYKCDLCLFTYPQGLVLNVGSKEYPRYRDRPCHAASRWYDKALESQGTTPGQLKTTQPRKYASHVFRFRVMSPDDPEDVKAAAKCVTKQGRRAQAAVFFESERHSTAFCPG